MSNDRDLDGIFDRIAKRNATDEDIQTLRQLLRITEGQNVIQIGKYSVNIAEGRDLHIGDKIYQSTDAETIRAIVQQVLAEKIRDDTFQRLFSQSKSSLVDWDWGLKLLEQKQSPEIRKRLTDTLGRDRILMDVSSEERQRWVNRSPLAADRTLQIDGRDCGTLDANKMLIETFGRDDIEKKLLILGAPGAGKTTALLSLAKQLVEGAISQPRTVIPVIFELSTWRNDNQSIESWLIEQLYDLHGGNRKAKLYEQWLERQVLLPLMDGLDELGLERQKKCTEKLNEFAEHYPHLVVCCRVKEFETVDIKLRNLRGAVCLQSLSNLQIQHYFDSLQRPELWGAIQTTPSLQAMLELTTDSDPGLLRVPLFVKLVADVYDLQQPISGKADLLDKYIDRQLSLDKREIDRRKELNRYKWEYKTVKIEPDWKKTRRHLSWLAQNLQNSDAVDFLIEKMQPSYLKSDNLEIKYEFISFLINCLIIGTIYGLFGLSIGITTEWIILLSLIMGVFSSLAIWAYTQSNTIKSVTPLQISISNIFTLQTCALILLALFTRPIRTMSMFGLKHGMILLLIVFVLNYGLVGLNYWLIITLSGWFNLSLFLVLSTIVKQLNVGLRPNQGICNLLQAQILWITISCIFPILIFIVFSKFQSLYFREPISCVAMIILCQNLVIGGGEACLQHLSLRIVLWQSGLPWNFSRFLNYCVERRLLLRVGGSYRFLHRELLDHFAQSNH
jgi:DNA polymerase III delta prime subunit